MKYDVLQFKGESPITGPTKLPAGMATAALNCKLTSGDLEAFNDFGNFFALTKDPIINTIWMMKGPPPNYWLQFTQGEVAYGTNIDLTLGAVPGDTSYRTLITGLAGGPQETNLYYATDPSQQGASPAGAYPYKTYPLAVPGPTSAPVAVAPTITGTTTVYEYAQEASVNNASVVTPGSGYKVGDILTLAGGILAVPGLTAQITVNNVTSLGAIDTAIPGCVSLTAQGVYQNNAGPGSTTINQVGLVLPAASITVGAVGSASSAGTLTVASAAGNQTVSYTGIAGNTLTGCTGGTGAVTNGASAQFGPVTVASSDTTGSGVGATFLVTVVPQQGSAGTPPPGWGFNGYASGGSFALFAIANNQWRIQQGQGDLTVVYSTTAYSLRTANAFAMQVDATNDASDDDLVFQFAGTGNGQTVGGQVVGPSLVIDPLDGTLTLYNSIVGTNGDAVTGDIVNRVNYAFTGNTQYRVYISAVAATNATQPGFSVTARVALASAPTVIVATVVGFVQYAGEQFGVGVNNRRTDSTTYFENLVLTVTQPATGITDEDTNYVYTLVRQLQSSAVTTFTEESGPSNPSGTVVVPVNTTVTPNTFGPVQVTIPAAPAGDNIAFVRLYRLVEVSDASGLVSEQYLLVTQLPADTVNPTTYNDSTLDTALDGTLLPSATWQPPPSNLQGITTGPNGITAGFADNTVYLSAQNFPHAWPAGNTLTTADTVVAIAWINTTLLIITEGVPYTAFGSDPSAFTMTKESFSQGNVSKRSTASHRQVGIIFATGTGLVAYRGQGALAKLTEDIFSIEQWQALNPASIIGVVHNDQYFFWYTTLAGVKGGFILDVRREGFGVTPLDFHVTSAYVYPKGDILYLTPDLSIYPINGSVVAAPSKTVCQWEGASTLRPYSWQRSDFLIPTPTSFYLARVEADDYTSIHLTISNEYGIALDVTVSNKNPIIMAIPGGEPGERWSFTLTGVSVINTLEVVEDIQEFR